MASLRSQRSREVVGMVIVSVPPFVSNQMKIKKMLEDSARRRMMTREVIELSPSEESDGQVYSPEITKLKKRNQGGRHFRALCRKNWINWKRTWCGSCLEFACPFLLMLILVWARTAIDKVSVGGTDLFQL